MGLLGGYTGKDGYTGPDNKVIRQAEFARELRTLVQSRVGLLWQIETITTEAFSFVGMTASAAADCAAAMKTLYTVGITHWVVNQAGNLESTTQQVCTVDIRSYPEEGGMWRVDVDRNKNQTTLTLFEEEA